MYYSQTDELFVFMIKRKSRWLSQICETLKFTQGEVKTFLLKTWGSSWPSKVTYLIYRCSTMLRWRSLDNVPGTMQYLIKEACVSLPLWGGDVLPLNKKRWDVIYTKQNILIHILKFEESKWSNPKLRPKSQSTFSNIRTNRLKHDFSNTNVIFHEIYLLS